MTVSLLSRIHFCVCRVIKNTDSCKRYCYFDNITHYSIDIRYTCYFFQWKSGFLSLGGYKPINNLHFTYHTKKQSFSMTTSELLAIKSFNRYQPSILSPPWTHQLRQRDAWCHILSPRVEQNYYFSRQGDSNVLLASLPEGIVSMVQHTRVWGMSRYVTHLLKS